MGEIKVDFNQLGSLADNLNSTASKIQGQLDELEQMLKPLISTWEGSAQEAYHQAQREWDQSAQRMQEITAKMGAAVNVARESYQQGEQRNAGMFGG